jgi:hypothetical protein
VNSVQTLNSRSDLLLYVAKLLPQNPSIVELGVFKGAFAAEMTSVLVPSSIVMVDTWVGQVECGDKDGLNIEVSQLEDVYQELLKVIPTCASLMKMTTTQALRQFPDRSVDFIYVDAGHDYFSVASDLKHSARVAKQYIGGHDYCPAFPGTMAAVNEFCIRQYWVMDAITQDGCPSYLLRRTT